MTSDPLAALLDRLRAEIPEVSPAAARRLVEGGARLLDVRGDDEAAAGVAAGAEVVGRDHLEARVVALAPLEQPLVLYCASGIRSLLAARSLRDLGFADVRSLAGGFDAWKAAGLPVERPALLPAAARERYARHLVMADVGPVGQAALLGARVLVVGVGGLGAPAAMYLAAAGVGALTVVDDDVVERSNLQRQVLHADADVGRAKVDSAVAALRAQNPSIEVRGVTRRVTRANADDLVQAHDVILDGTDDYAARAALNDACVRHGRPYVFGAVHGFEGQVAVFQPAVEGGCYRCLFPTAPSAAVAPTCAEAGVLGAVPGIIGVMQALEVLKLTLGLDGVLRGRLLQYDARGPRMLTLAVSRRPGCPGCGAPPSP